MIPAVKRNINGIFHSISAWQITVFVVFATLVTYIPAIKGPFFGDDFVYVAGNENLLSMPLYDFWKIFFTRTNSYEYLPIRDLSYMIDAAVWGFRPAVFHLHNILLYAFCCLFVWLLTAEIQLLISSHSFSTPTKRGYKPAWICLLTTCLFAVHPAHVESVAWISARKDLLATFFSLASLWQFAKGVNNNKIITSNLIVSYFLFAFALLSKSTVITLPVVSFLLACAYFKEKGSFLKTLMLSFSLVSPLLILSILSLVVNLTIGNETGVSNSAYAQAVLGEHRHYLTVIKILAELAKITFLPFWPKLIYSLPDTGPLSALAIISGLGVLAATGFSVFWWYKKKSLIGFGIVFFSIFCVPYLQLIPFKTWSLASDRFVLLASYGLILSFASILIKLPLKALKSISVVIGLVLFIITANQALKWRTNEDLLIDTATKSPGNYIAQILVITSVYLPNNRFNEAESAAQGIKSSYDRKLILSFVRAKSALARNDIHEARKQFGPYIQFIEDTNFVLLPLCGELAEKSGNYSDAAKFYYRYLQNVHMLNHRRKGELDLERVRQHFAPQLDRLRLAVKEVPNDIIAFGQLANLELELFLVDDAIKKYKTILQQKPGLPPALYNLGLAFSAKHDYKKAAIEIQKAIGGGLISSDVLNNLAIAHKNATAFNAAEAAFIQAISLDPNNFSPVINLSQMYLALNDKGKAKKLLSDLIMKSNISPDIEQAVLLMLQEIE